MYTETSWALAFRASSAVGQSVWDTLQEDGRHDDPVEMRECVLSASSLPCLTHFRSYIVDHWSNTDQAGCGVDNVPYMLFRWWALWRNELSRRITDVVGV